jgi:hypothetical protein
LNQSVIGDDDAGLAGGFGDRGGDLPSCGVRIRTLMP